MAGNSKAPSTGSKKARALERQRLARRRKIVTRAAIGFGVIGVIVVAVFALSAGETATGTTETESWDLPALSGDGRVALSDFAGKPTVAAFFASWCTVCRRELPGFGDLSREIGDQVNFVGINTMNNGSGLGFAHDMGIADWPLARDIGMQDGRQLATNFGAVGSPTTVLYDATGKVVDVTLGGMTAETLLQKLHTFFGISA